MDFDVKIDAPPWLGGRGQGRDPRSLFSAALDAWSTQVVADAKDKLDESTQGTGALGQTIGHDLDGLAVEFTWGYPYGHILEYGPDRKSWEIEALYAKALRFPILSASGSVERVQYVARGYKIQRVWTEDQLRPHVNPSIDENWPDLESDLQDALEVVLN